MLEKEIEELIANYPDEFFPNEGFTIIGRQIAQDGRRFDLMFTDKYNRKIVIEVKRGVLTREASGQIVEYYGLLKSKDHLSNIELILVANIILNERKVFLETAGISCKEISEKQLDYVVKKYNLDTKLDRLSRIELISKNENPISGKSDVRKINTIQDLYDRIKNPEGQHIIDYIIEEFRKTGLYQCSVEQKKIFKSYSIHRIFEGKLIYDYAFIVNRNDLLFYIRKPGENWLLQNYKLNRLEKEMIVMRKNKANEITIRIDSLKLAKELCSLLI